MHKAEDPRMQRLSLKLVRTFCRTVYGIAQKRMSDARHMDADLVSPSRLQPALDMGEILESRDHPVMGHRGRSRPHRPLKRRERSPGSGG